MNKVKKLKLTRAQEHYLYSNGHMDIKQLSKDTGLTVSTIKKWFKENPVKTVENDVVPVVPPPEPIKVETVERVLAYDTREPGTTIMTSKQSAADDEAYKKSEMSDTPEKRGQIQKEYLEKHKDCIARIEMKGKRTVVVDQ